MRFDDTLETVLASDLATPYGIQSAWRQLVDLIGRRRVQADTGAMSTLRAIRGQVPLPVRAASARALEFADPPPPLVWLFALDELAVALPVLRSARMASSEWIQLLPELAPAARSVVRNRRDLGPAVKRALDSFGPIDFVLSDDRSEADAAWTPVPFPAAAPAQSGTVASPEDISRGLPPVAALESGDQNPDMDYLDTLTEVPPEAFEAGTAANEEGTYEIADVVARIDAFWRHREEAADAPPPPVAPADQFRFETDAKGVLRWVEGVGRSAVIGLSLDSQNGAAADIAEGPRVDGVAAGAFRRRAGFANARLAIAGESDASGDWLISAIPVFDSANGRFTGYRGTARRPRVDERAEPVRAPVTLPADSLRQLVHELRTPTNAIAGFAEMIETQMLGPVSDPYRDRAQIIRAQARELLGAIDDLDLAARIDSAALSLVPGRVALRPVLAGIADDLSELAVLRGSAIALPIDDLTVSGDRRAVERLLARLLATLVSASVPGERIGVHMALEGGDMVTILLDRPKALADYPGESVLGIDDEKEDATLLGTGFALRLARNLARELGGAMEIGPDSLTLRLPAAVTATMGQAHLN